MYIEPSPCTITYHLMILYLEYAFNECKVLLNRLQWIFLLNISISPRSTSVTSETWRSSPLLPKCAHGGIAYQLPAGLYTSALTNATIARAPIPKVVLCLHIFNCQRSCVYFLLALILWHDTYSIYWFL